MADTNYLDTLRSAWGPNDPFFKTTSRLDNLIVDYQDINSPDPANRPNPKVTETKCKCKI